MVVLLLIRSIAVNIPDSTYMYIMSIHVFQVHVIYSLVEQDLIIILYDICYHGKSIKCLKHNYVLSFVYMLLCGSDLTVS